MLLHSPNAHERLTERRWDEAWVAGRIERIADEAERAVGRDGLWDVHPLDVDKEEGTELRCGVYMGAAGVLWALGRLGRDHPELAAGLLDRYRREPDWPGVVPGYLAGEAGILLVSHQLDPSKERADLLERAIRSNAGNKSNELLWGSPGTMLAALAMHRRTGEERFADAYRESARELWARWTLDEQLGVHVWTQDLYDRIRQHVGAGHGFAGNVLALALGRELLDPGQAAELDRRAVETATAFAVRDDGLANWPPLAGRPPVLPPEIRTQWCHGAPGMVTSLAGVAAGDDAFTRLLEQGGELTWRAGPLAKGAGLCHGTAGNGVAFLSLHARTGRDVWLDRARAFAVHALLQVERDRERYGVGRHSLFTGDLGAAVMARSCIEPRAGMPVLDWT